MRSRWGLVVSVGAPESRTWPDVTRMVARMSANVCKASASVHKVFAIDSGAGRGE